MQELIKVIRAELALNQEQLARRLGVSPVTVNRWENGKAKPTVMAQNRLYEICREAEVDLADYIVKSCTADEAGVFYHASRKGIQGNIQPISRSRCDFGRGFYMGTEAVQPLPWYAMKKNRSFIG